MDEAKNILDPLCEELEVEYAKYQSIASIGAEKSRQEITVKTQVKLRIAL